MEEQIISPNDSQPLFRRSYETSILVEKLKELEPGGSFTYGALSDACGVEITGASYQLNSARQIVARENDMIIEPVWGKGVRRLTDEEIVQSASRGITYISRRAKREADRLAKSDFAALDDAGRKRYATHASVFGAIAVMSSSKGVKAIEGAVTGSQRELPVKETLALFQE